MLTSYTIYRSSNKECCFHIVNRCGFASRMEIFTFGKKFDVIFFYNVRRAAPKTIKICFFKTFFSCLFVNHLNWRFCCHYSFIHAFTCFYAFTFIIIAQKFSQSSLRAIIKLNMKNKFFLQLKKFVKILPTGVNES